MAIRDVARQLLTESDNTTHDLYRYIALFSALSGIAFQGYAIFKGQTYSIQDFGVGMGALLAGVGVALGLKKENGNGQ